MKATLILAIALLSAGVSPVSAQNSYWIPAAAHLAGVGGSVWRTDLAVVNLEARPATVELHFHQTSGSSNKSFVIESGRQQIFEDAVAQLTSGEASGSLQVLSNERLTVRSRTYNAGLNGSFGQALDGITQLDGIDFNEKARLVQLREDASFRSNIGAVNMGEVVATLQISLYEASGAFAGRFELNLQPSEQRQDSRPFRNRFQRSDIVGGFAEVQLTAGNHVYVYGSVVDNYTNDPTTISMDQQMTCE